MKNSFLRGYHLIVRMNGSGLDEGRYGVSTGTTSNDFSCMALDYLGGRVL
jgi:hypothetical protein